jgi:hypothetical protein
MTFENSLPTARSCSLRVATSTLLLALCAAALPAAAQTVFRDGFDPPPEPEVPEACSDPLIAPEGWDMNTSTWSEAWSSPDGSPQASYPNSVGFPVPLGANKNKIKVIHFVPQANQTVDISWDTVQANEREGYKPRVALSMFISISPCPGDVRAVDNYSEDPFLRGGCRQQGGGGSMFFTTQPGMTNPEIVCTLQAGTTYFMNVAPIDPRDGLTLGEHTCDDASVYSDQGCEVQAVHRGY